MRGELEIRPADACRFDAVTLGEVMLRLDPGEGRVRTARSFTVSEGGGEYNVGRALRRTFGQRVAHVTAIGDNEVGRLLEDLLLQGGVCLDHVVWKRADPRGRRHRTPLNFTERGFGVRSSVGVYDRAHSATGALEPGEVDWELLFGHCGARWFHTGGIFAGLTASTREVARQAIAAANRHDVVVSYDFNYRPSQWVDAGGIEGALQLMHELLDGVHVLFGLPSESFDATAARLADRHRRLAIVATPTRTVRSASSHDWGGLLWSRDGGVRHGAGFDDLPVLDRVGGGDGFAAGLIHGLLEGRAVEEALAWAIALGALVMTTPGDTSMVDAAEVARLVSGEAPDIRR